MFLNLARAWRDSFFPLLALDKVEDAFLPIRQHGLSSPNWLAAQVQMNRYRRFDLASDR
jgi:hypothetical protein